VLNRSIDDGKWTFALPARPRQPRGSSSSKVRTGAAQDPNGSFSLRLPARSPPPSLWFAQHTRLAVRVNRYTFETPGIPSYLVRSRQLRTHRRRRPERFPLGAGPYRSFDYNPGCRLPRRCIIGSRQTNAYQVPMHRLIRPLRTQTASSLMTVQGAAGHSKPICRRCGVNPGARKRSRNGACPPIGRARSRDRRSPPAIRSVGRPRPPARHRQNSPACRGTFRAAR
jgi:hypothetical protein